MGGQNVADGIDALRDAVLRSKPADQIILEIIDGAFPVAPNDIPPPPEAQEARIRKLLIEKLILDNDSRVIERERARFLKAVANLREEEELGDAGKDIALSALTGVLPP